MRDFMIFDRDGEYTDEWGDPCTFGDHLQYLRDYDGTPDCWDSFETLNEARRALPAAPGNPIVISACRDYRPVAC